MKMNSIILLSLLFFSVSCEKITDHGYYIKVQNNTDMVVWCYSSYNYPDTSMPSEKPLLQMIKPNSYTQLNSKDKWEDVLPNNIISIYILSNDTINAYSWDVIRSSYNILKRYDLSIEQLKDMNWTVTYP